MALDVLQWTNKSRDDVNFVLEGKLQFTQATEANWRRWNVKMTPVSALLVTLGRNSLEPPSSLQDDGILNFPAETGVVEAALLLIREKNNRFSMIRVSIMKFIRFSFIVTFTTQPKAFGKCALPFGKVCSFADSAVELGYP